MPTKPKPKSDHKEMWQTKIKFVIDMFILTLGYMGPLVIVLIIFRKAHSQMPLWMLGPLVILGLQLILSSSKHFFIMKPVPIKMSIGDLIVVNLAIWIFFFVAFAPINASNENSCGLIFLTVVSGAALALCFSYLLGTAELRKKIRDFPRNFRRVKKK